MDYCYEAEFALEGVGIDTHLKEVPFSLAPDPSGEKAARLNYSFCMPNLSEIEAEEKSKRDVNNFLNFVLLGMYQSGDRSAFSVNFLKIRCSNYKALREAKQPLPMFGEIKFRTFYKINDVTLNRVVGELKKYSAVLPDNIYVAMTFWRTGLSSDDEYSRFEQVWKAFEIFHRTITKSNIIEMASIKQWLTHLLKPADMTNICDLFSKVPNKFAALDLMIRAERCKSALDCLVKQNFTSASGKTNYSKDLALAVTKNNYLETLANTMMCLSKLRNKVFHANIFSDKERQIVFIGCSVLASILRLSFDRYISQLI